MRVRTISLFEKSRGWNQHRSIRTAAGSGAEDFPGGSEEHGWAIGFHGPLDSVLGKVGRHFDETDHVKFIGIGQVFAFKRFLLDDEVDEKSVRLVVTGQWVRMSHRAISTILPCRSEGHSGDCR